MDFPKKSQSLDTYGFGNITLYNYVLAKQHYTGDV